MAAKKNEKTRDFSGMEINVIVRDKNSTSF